VQDTTDLLPADTANGASATHAAGSTTVLDQEDSTNGKARRPRGTGLAANTLPQLQELAGGLGVTGTARMRKGQLITAIQIAQGTSAEANGTGTGTERAPDRGTAAAVAVAEVATLERPVTPATDDTRRASNGATSNGAGAHAAVADAAPDAGPDSGGTPATARQDQRPERRPRPDRAERADRPDAQQGERQQGQRDRQQGQRDRPNTQGQQNAQGQQNTQGQQGGQGNDLDDDDGSRRGRRGRYRDRRNRNRQGGQGLPGGEPDTTVGDDDVLVPVAGILDLLDNYAFVRTTGYLPGPSDVYVSLAQVRRYSLRRGDAITGAVKQPRDGEPRKDKFNALVRLDSVNGVDPEEGKQRPEFTKLTPLYPQERLRLETEPHILTTRVIDLVTPIGKGQRALIVSPPKAGKTMVLQAIANAVTTNNPECHLMVVLVDERPEEVTDMQRSVKGEVIASTFDRHPADHITAAELSIERAKRLVELGHDVVVLLDSITRLGRAYNMAAPASGRILTGGVDSAALYPPKRFLGAARNIENGGSLTIIATALVETGSAMDTVIFEEFKGTGNAELKLDRRLSDKRIFPAIDIDPSGTRKEELLLSRDELQIVIKLRRVLHAVEGGSGGLELLLDKLRETKSNVEFLLQVQKTMPGAE